MIVTIMVKRFSRKRRFTKRRVSRRRFTRKKGASRGNVYSRSFKRPRKFNKGKLRLQKSLMNGSSLPFETSTRLFWRGSGNIQFGVYQTDDAHQIADQTFTLNNIAGPTIMPPSGAGSENLKGKFAYRDVWAGFYKYAAVSGSKITIKLTRPIYPTAVRNVDYASSALLGLSTNPRADMTHGFWYLRYRYRKPIGTSAQGGQGTPIQDTTMVGHPIMNNQFPDYNNWANMRDFMIDPTVLWFRDKMPRATKMHYSRGGIDRSANNQHLLFGPGGLGIEDNTPRLTYELEFNNKPTTLVGAFSAKKHFGFQSTREYLNTITVYDASNLHPYTWQPTATMPFTPLIPQTPSVAQRNVWDNNFMVYIGYIGFNHDGIPCSTVPPDGIAHRNVEISHVMKVHLRDPQVQPWTGAAQGTSARVANSPKLDESEDELMHNELEALFEDDEEDSSEDWDDEAPATPVPLVVEDI